jgi:CheY-like chemotaxis protein
MNQNLAKPRDPKTILIVDDNPLNVGVVVDHLEHRGFDVAVALGGEEALERARYLGPDLILLDAMMPGMDGFETCRRLKAAPETSDIPVIFMTALGDVSDKVHGFEAGGVDYVRKPFQVGDLLARVNAQLTLGEARQRVRDELSALQSEVGRRKQPDETGRAEPGARFRQFFIEAEHGILLVECEDHLVIDANPAAGELLGIPMDELIGRPLSELVAGLTPMIRESGEPNPAELGRWPIAGGNDLRVRVTATRRRDRSGEMVELGLHRLQSDS